MFTSFTSPSLSCSINRRHLKLIYRKEIVPKLTDRKNDRITTLFSHLSPRLVTQLDKLDNSPKNPILQKGVNSEICFCVCAMLQRMKRVDFGRERERGEKVN